MTNDDERDRLPGQTVPPARRRLRTVDAFIDLVLEGRRPTPEDVAERAGVSRATFFRYVSSLDQLRSDATARVLERFPELYTLPTDGLGSRSERIGTFVDARVQLHESLHPLMLLLRAHAANADDAGASEFVDGARQILADQVRRHFEADLAPHTPARRDDLVTTIAAVTSVEAWQQFRRSHGRSPTQTRRAWRAALTSLLADPAPT